jgi:hypothetical protein
MGVSGAEHKEKEKEREERGGVADLIVKKGGSYEIRAAKVKIIFMRRALYLIHLVTLDRS